MTRNNIPYTNCKVCGKKQFRERRVKTNANPLPSTTFKEEFA